MTQTSAVQRQLYRIWIVDYDDWRPTTWRDVPPRATAREPAAAAALSAAAAQAFLEGFNGRTLHHRQRLWAVAVPVALRYEGDARAGEAIAGFPF